MRWIKKVIIWAVCLCALFPIVCNILVVATTSGRVYDTQDKLPEHRMALVLGTSHRTVAGGPNPYFQKRIETAAELFRNGKVDHFILSGDNRSKYYNEPNEMRKSLVKQGVP